MADLHYDVDSIYAGAQMMNNEPRAHMIAAHKFAANDTQLGPTALGVVGIPAIMTYNNMRGEIEGNLKSGVETIQRMADGLSAVAKNYGKANAASTIKAGAYKIPYAPPRPVGTDIGTPQAWVMGVTGGPVLLVRAAYVYYMLGIATSIDKLCGVSLGMWAMFKPNDADLNKVAEAWVAIERQLDSTKDAINVITRNQLSLAKWKTNGADNSRQAFDSFLMNSFFVELDETRERAATTQEKLREMKQDLNLVQTVFTVYVMACLTALILSAIALFYPPLTALAMAAKKAIASALTIGTAGALAAILTVATTNVSEIGALWFGREQAFQPNRVNPDGNTDFRDVNRMAWTWTAGQIRVPKPGTP